MRCSMGYERCDRTAGQYAARYVEDGMLVGLGSGTTFYWTLLELADRIKGGLKMKGIPTSLATERLAFEWGIPLASFAECPRLDLYIDGAKEINPRKEMIKGGGGSFLREKLVAEGANRRIIVVSGNKQVPRLGSIAVPVEIVPFGSEWTLAKLRDMGCKPDLRTEQRQFVVSDNGNYIADCDFGPVPNPADLHRKIKAITGVVETGLFVGMADEVIIGGESGVEIWK